MALPTLIPPSPRAPAARPELPGHIAQSIWRGDELSCAQAGGAEPTGFAPLDAELPGAGWPLQGMTEILQGPQGASEWRLLGPALARRAQRGAVALVAPPMPLQAAALAQMGLDVRQLIRIQPATHAQRLWVAEQLVKSQAGGAVLVWLPQARAEQLRRLQVHAQSGGAPLFVLRPLACARDASPAPLRVSLRPHGCWHLSVQLIKRRGAAHETPLILAAVPPALEAVLPARLRLEVQAEGGAAGLGRPPGACPGPADAARAPGPARKAAPAREAEDQPGPAVLAVPARADGDEGGLGQEARHARA